MRFIFISVLRIKSMDGHLYRHSLRIYWTFDEDLHLNIKIHGYGGRSNNINDLMSILEEIYIDETGVVAEKVTVRIFNQGADSARLQELFENRYGICPIVTLDWQFIRA